MAGKDGERSPRPDILGPDDLTKRRTGDTDSYGVEIIGETMELLNKLRDFVAPIRQSDPMHYEGSLITALVLCAGGIHGELLAMGACPDLTPQAVGALLSTNWYSGVTMGERHVRECAANWGVDPTTGRPPEDGQS